MKKIAIMQPYFLPYVRYFQLIDAVDCFVFLDDVQYIRRGWVNRNRISCQHANQQNNGWQYITLPVKKHKREALITEIKFSDDQHSSISEKLARQVLLTYGKSSTDYAWFYPVFYDAIEQSFPSLSCYLMDTIQIFAQYLGLQTQFISSSDLPLSKKTALKGERRIIEICRELGATEYINLPGGRDLYDHKLFFENKIDLRFIQSQIKPEESYSIVDLLLTGKLSENNFLPFRNYACLV